MSMATLESGSGPSIYSRSWRRRQRAATCLPITSRWCTSACTRRSRRSSEVERLIAARSGVVIWLGIDPHTEWLHGIPRFRELISELKLPVVGVPASQ